MSLNKICGNCIYWSPNHAEHKRCKGCGDYRNNFVPRDMKCPVPSCQSSMIYYKKDAYLECPDCGTLVQPFFMEKSDKAAIRQEFEKQLPCDRGRDTTQGTLVTAKSRVKGGSKSKGRGDKKQKLAKQSVNQIHNILANQGNKIIYKKDAN